MSSSGGDSDELVMAVIISASLVGFVLGVVFIAEPPATERFTELFFVTHKVALRPYAGPLDFNYSGMIAEGRIFDRDFWVLGPDTDHEVLVLRGEGGESRFRIYQTFKLGGTYLTFADATPEEALFHEYPREVLEFTDVRLSFVIRNEMRRDHTYHYRTYLAKELVDEGEVPVKDGERKVVISSFPVGTTNNKWTRIFVVLDTGQNISFGFRTYH